MNGVEQHPQYWYTLSCYHSVNGYYTQLYHMTTDTQRVGQGNGITKHHMIIILNIVDYLLMVMYYAQLIV